MCKQRLATRLILAIGALSLIVYPGHAQNGKGNGKGNGNGNNPPGQMRSTTQGQRKAARYHQAPQKVGVSKRFAGLNPATAAYSPLAVGPTTLATMAAPLSPPDYFGVANWALSPLPAIAADGTITGGIRKFVDTLPPLCPAANDLGQCIPVAVPDVATFPGSDYYEISLTQFNEQLHADLPKPGTQLRGYVQTNMGTDTTVCGAAPLPACTAANNTVAPAPVHYLGPLILARKNRPVRVKFTNNLPTGMSGNLFIPTDTTYMGAGMGPGGATYTQNRATLHLHGGATPWISDGTPHQWTAPVGETSTTLTRGVSARNVPDMWFDSTNGSLIASCAGLTACAAANATNDPGPGSLTFYWTNQQGGRLMFYHDHAYGITRLNVYAGEAAGYLLVDPAEEDLLAGASVPGTLGANTAADLAHLVPLVIQDKTFGPDSGTTGGQLAAQDPTWDVASYGGFGNLWFPHVYMPNQNPADITGANAYGRWDYGAWFWPPQNPGTYVSQPYTCTSAAYDVNNPPAFPPLMCPGTPNPSGTPEGFMDTPLVNGTAYPKLTVDPAAYRFQILSAGNDRTLNLGLYVADPLSLMLTNAGSGYTSAPAVTISGGGGSGATATAIVSGGQITSITVDGGGAGYVVVPNVTITGDGTGATATAVIGANGGALTAIVVTNPGTGYTTATVTIDPSPLGCTPTTNCASATANIAPPGSLLGLTLTNAGTGYTTPPAVTIAAPTTIGGVTATAVASVNTEVKMVDALPHTTTSPLPSCSTLIQTGSAGLAMAVLSGGAPVNNTGLPANCWPSTWPTDGRDGGVPDPTTAGPPIIQIGTEGGLLPAPAVIPSTPVGYEYNRRSITVLNVFTHGLLLGPAERADVVIDFSKFAGKTLILYNDAPAPVPAFDPRSDYYTGAPDQTTTGGAPSTLPGYGPNTRTIMQIQVNATGTANAFSLASLQSPTTGLPSVFATTQDKIIVPEPSYPAGNGGTAKSTYLRIQDTSIPMGPVTSLTLTAGGSGYISAPSVSITGGGGSGAAATATIGGANVTAVTMLTKGTGYTSAPTVQFTGGTTGTAATATAVLTRIVSGITLTAGGAGYTGVPTVTISGGGGSGATATASITGGLNTITVATRGSGYTTAPTVTFTGGGGAGAAGTAVISNGRVTSITITNRGTGYTSAPTITLSGGGGTGATATATVTQYVNAVTVTNAGSGYTSTPSVSFSGGGGTGAAATAALTGIVNSVTVTNGGSGYTSAPTVSFVGGGGTGATATATVVPGYVNSITLTAGGAGYTSAPTVSFNPPLGAVATATTGTTPLSPKAIQELFTLDYGRMNATLGVELPFTNFNTQTTIPYGYVDPPTELFRDGETQLWKITHNGVDTHFIHFHLFNVQVINRVGWDGAIKPPDQNELSFKDTVRMNPLEDIVVALAPVKQVLPWDLPNSIRVLDVTQPQGAALAGEFTNIDPTNQPATVTNDLTNFGWEYVWHCHILGHEENDMMRAMSLIVPPADPGSVAAAATNKGVVVTWTDNSVNETGFTIQRATGTATGPTGAWTTVGAITSQTGPSAGSQVTYTDSTAKKKTTYWYRVIANNMVGYTKGYAAPAVGYPHVSGDSNAVQAGASVTP